MRGARASRLRRRRRLGRRALSSCLSLGAVARAEETARPPFADLQPAPTPEAAFETNAYLIIHVGKTGTVGEKDSTWRPVRGLVYRIDTDPALFFESAGRFDSGRRGAGPPPRHRETVGERLRPRHRGRGRDPLGASVGGPAAGPAASAPSSAASSCTRRARACATSPRFRSARRWTWRPTTTASSGAAGTAAGAEPPTRDRWSAPAHLGAAPAPPRRGHGIRRALLRRGAESRLDGLRTGRHDTGGAKVRAVKHRPGRSRSLRAVLFCAALAAGACGGAGEIRSTSRSRSTPP